MIFGALATTSWGKRIESSVPSLSPERRKSTFMPRLIPTRPPTPLSVKP